MSPRTPSGWKRRARRSGVLERRSTGEIWHQAFRSRSRKGARPWKRPRSLACRWLGHLCERPLALSRLDGDLPRQRAIGHYARIRSCASRMEDRSLDDADAESKDRIVLGAVEKTEIVIA